MASPSNKNQSLSDILQTLERLQDTLKSLDDKQSASKLSHYRVIPSSLQNALDLLHRAASSIHAGSTKFALMAKIDVNEAVSMARDNLLPGCQWICTAALVIHQESTGCSKCLRHAYKQAARAILRATTQLVECFVTTPSALTDNENLAAQRTGAVWETCQVVMNDKTSSSTSSNLASSNCLAMRRDLMSYMKECNETMEEFQDMIDAGPALREDANGVVDVDNDDGETNGDINDDNDNEGEPSWEQFLGGGTDQYTSEELPVATAALALVKCSRGCINVALQACDAIGHQISERDNNVMLSDDDQAKLQWISRLFDCAQNVGEGMTDLGAALYPPIRTPELDSQVRRQSSCMEELLLCLFDKKTAGGEAIDLGRDIVNLATKLQAAVSRRKEDAMDALASVV